LSEAARDILDHPDAQALPRDAELSANAVRSCADLVSPLEVAISLNIELKNRMISSWLSTNLPRSAA
jgi:hypothetical protein